MSHDLSLPTLFKLYGFPKEERRPKKTDELVWTVTDENPLQAAVTVRDADKPNKRVLLLWSDGTRTCLSLVKPNDYE